MRNCFRLVVAAIVLGFAVPSDGATIGTLDAFSGGMTAGWFAGGGPGGSVPPVPPQVIASGGPAGAGDAYLQVTATGGGGPGSRLSVMNATQWAGNYIAAGIGSIEMDLINLGANDLTIRLLFEDPIPGPPQNEAVSSVGVFLGAGSGWVHVSFDLDELTALQGTVLGALSNTTILRIIHASDPSGPSLATPIAGVLGIDNILAVAGPTAVDEPASGALLALALVAFALLRARRRRAYADTMPTPR
jgi:MYXO-CTERM domain-containing protein